MRKICSTLIFFTFSLVFIQNSFADDTDAYFQSAEIDSAEITISSNETSGNLRFRIVNNSSGKLTILGVTGAGDIHSKIMARIDDINYAELGSIPLLSEESLDMTTTHMFIHLFNIEEPLKIGQKIDLKLLLASGELPFSAHIKPSGK